MQRIISIISLLLGKTNGEKTTPYAICIFTHTKLFWKELKLIKVIDDGLILLVGISVDGQSPM